MNSELKEKILNTIAHKLATTPDIDRGLLEFDVFPYKGENYVDFMYTDKKTGDVYDLRLIVKGIA